MNAYRESHRIHARVKCPGCGYGWSRECDTALGPCGCGAWHDHDPMVKSRCRPLGQRIPWR